MASDLTNGRVAVRFPSFRWKAAAGAALALAVPDKTNITVDIYLTIDFAGLYIAQMDGLFRKQGLNVRVIFAPASQLAVTSVINGTPDISGSDYVTYIDNELNDNARLRIFAEASSLQQHALGLLAAPHSQITTLAGLEGHTIGVTSSDDIDTPLVRALLAENDISANSVNVKFGFQLLNIAQQLNEGQASAAAVPEPFAGEGEQQYGLQELADVDQALEQGQEIADTDRTAFEAAVEKYLGIKPETAAVLNVPSYPLSVTPTQLQRVVDTMVQFGMLPRSDASFKVTAMTG